MKVEQKQSMNGGIGFLGLLTIVFITLKLLGFINWSWWLVCLPVLIPIIIFILILIMIVIYYSIKWLILEIKSRGKRK